MAVSAYVGLHGSGKSYSVFEHVIVPALKAGRRVWTNIPFDADAVQEYCGAVPVAFETDDIKRDPYWFSQVFEVGAVLVLDECQKIWPSGVPAFKLNQDHCTFFDEHRHMVGADGQSTEIVLVTQDLGKLATRIRDDVHFTYRTVKLSVLGLDKRFRVDVYQGPVKGPNPPEKLKVREMFGTYRKEIYRLYQSHTKSLTGFAGNEKRVDDRANVFKTWMFKFAAGSLLAFPLVVWLGVKSFHGIFGGDRPAAAPSAPAAAPAVPSNLPGTPGQAKPQPDQRKGRGMLSDVEVSIAFGNGIGSRLSYVFALVDGHKRATVSGDILRKLGYKLEAVNGCLVRIVGPDFDRWVMCTQPVDDRPIVPVDKLAGGPS